MIELPRIVAGPAELGGVIRAAREESRPISLIVGLRPQWVTRTSLPPGNTDLGHLTDPLRKAHDAGDQTIYIGLFDGPEPIGDCPPNLALFRGGIASLHEACPERYARKAVSFGTLHADNLKRDDLLLLGEILLIGGGVYLYLIGEEGSQFTNLVVRRVATTGFSTPDVNPVTVENDPLPNWPRRDRLRILVSAAVLEPLLPSLDESDPFVVGGRCVWGRRVDPWALFAAARWLRQGFPDAPLRRKGDYHGIEHFTYFQVLPKDGRLHSRRKDIANAARVTVHRLASLFSAEGPSNRIERRRPFVRALAAEYFRHAIPPYSYRELWAFLNRITGYRHGLGELHEEDVAPVAYEHYDQFDPESRAILSKLFSRDRAAYERTGRSIPASLQLTPAVVTSLTEEVFSAGSGEISIREVWRRLSDRTGLSQATLQERFRPVVLVTLWRHLSALHPNSRQNLIQNLPNDLATLRGLGYEPPLEYLPQAEQERRLREALMQALIARSIGGWLRPASLPIQPTQTLTELVVLMRLQGITMSEDRLMTVLRMNPDLLWQAVDAGVIDKKFLEAKGIRRTTGEMTQVAPAPLPASPTPPPPPPAAEPAAPEVLQSPAVPERAPLSSLGDPVEQRAVLRRLEADRDQTLARLKAERARRRES